MPVMDQYKHQQLCWVDLSAHDMRQAQKVYETLVGWKTLATPSAAAMPYAQFGNGGLIGKVRVQTVRTLGGRHPRSIQLDPAGRAGMTVRVAVWALTLGLLSAAGPSIEACSILTLRNDSKVLMGNNEDYIEAGWVWFVPAKAGRYGRVNFGFENRFVQGGMNDRGLSFDAAVVPELKYELDGAKPNPANLLDKIMDECATVEEAIDYFEKHNCPHLSRTQFLLADASGASAVISWRPEAGLVVQRIEGEHQVVTNTRLDVSGYRCARFTRAERILAADDRSEVSVEVVADVLQAIHQYGAGAFTTYSTIYDLKARRVFVYNLSDFDDVVEIDLAEELAKGKHRQALAELFPHGPTVAELRDRPQRQEYGTRVEIDPSVLDRYVGGYTLTVAPDVTVQVTREGGNLRVASPGQSSALLVPESTTRFRLSPDRGEVSFQLGADGSVAGLTLHKQVDVYAERTSGSAPAPER